jgi:hypothetical protein
VILLTMFNPAGSRPQDGETWGWPLNPIGEVLFKNLPIKLAPIDFVLILLVLRAYLVIRLSDVGTAGIERRPLRPFVQACLLAAGAILAWTFYGVFLNGGSFADSLWQVRQPLWLPCLALAVSVASTQPGAITRLKRAVVISALVKSVEAILFYATVVKPKGLDLLYVTTHSDTVLWSTALAMLVSDWFEHRTRATRRNLTLYSIPMLLAMVFNNRRTVWVIVFASLAFIVAVAHRPVKRQLARLLVLLSPLLLAYIVVGMSPGAGSPVFKPVKMIRSVVIQDDASSSTRDIENLNLVVTMRQRPLIGMGFGHPYIELVVAYDVTKGGFTNYQYIPHNSFLGLWAFTGLFGPAAYFLPMLVANYYAINSRRRSPRPATRSAAAWSVCAVIAYLVQAWSDMGMQDWTSITCAALGMGVAASLAREVKADEEAEAAARRVVPEWEALRERQRLAALTEVERVSVR